MSLFRPQIPPKEPTHAGDSRETLKPDRTDVLALIIAAFQVLAPYVLLLVGGVVVIAVILLNVWK